MSQLHLRFYAELNEHLRPERRQTSILHAFRGAPSVKAVIEALGVPHAAVDLILVNGESVDFSHLVKDGDRVSVYPVFESLDIAPVARLRPRPLRRPRFVLDGGLSRLGRCLRMLGFDALCPEGAAGEELARISALESRILLTRDRGPLERGLVTHGYWVRESKLRLQALEVLRRFDLTGGGAEEQASRRRRPGV
jgi:hypothetical protein